MSQKRHSLGSRRGSGRFFPVYMVVYALAVVAFGVFMLQSRGDPLIITFAVVTAPIALLLAWEHERQH